MRLRLFLGPAIDVISFCALLALAQPPERAQILSFLAAVALHYLPRPTSPPAAVAGPQLITLGLRLTAAAAVVFFVRSGIFVLAVAGWGWPGLAAIVPAAAATALLIRPGFAYCVSNPSWRPGSGVGWQAGAIGVVAVAVALRLIYSGRVELLPEEAYYWSYARHLDFSYLDHPPMVGWLIGAGTAVFGDTEFGVRIGALCCGLITASFIYRLTRDLFGEASALVAVVLLQTLPFFFLTGMLMTPDAPLTAAWSAALYYSARALLAGRSEAWWRAGLCFGLGLLSKYTIALLGAAIVLFMLLDPPARRWFKRPQIYAAAVLALAVFSPVIWWNAHHDWASFLFQTSRRLADRPQFALPRLIASAIILLTPTGFAAVALLFFKGGSPAQAGRAGAIDCDPSRAWHFLKAAALFPLAVFALFSLRHEVKLDWTGAPWIGLLPALAWGIVHAAQSAAGGTRSFIRGAWAPTIIVLLLIYGSGLYDLTLGISGVGYGRHAELVPIGWRELGRQINAISAANQPGDAPVLVVGMDRYAIASEIAFYAPDQAKSVKTTSSGHLFGQVGLMYERWFPPAAEIGRTLLLVAWNRGDLAAENVISSVDRLEPIQEGVLTRGHDVIRAYYYRLAYGYRGPPAD